MTKLSLFTVEDMFDELVRRDLTVVLGVVSTDGKGDGVELYAQEACKDTTVADITDLLADHVVDYIDEMVAEYEDEEDEENWGLNENYDED